MSPSTKKMIRSRGSILLEALAAVVIMAVALTAVMGSLASSYRGVVQDQDCSKAVLLLENRLSQVFLKGVSARDVSDQDCPEPWSRFRCRAFVNVPPGLDLRGVKEARLSVLWPAGKRTRELGVTTWGYDDTDL